MVRTIKPKMLPGQLLLTAFQCEDTESPPVEFSTLPKGPEPPSSIAAEDSDSDTDMQDYRRMRQGLCICGATPKYLQRHYLSCKVYKDHQEAKLKRRRSRVRARYASERESKTIRNGETGLRDSL
jgi:hypothetical protein